MTYMEHLEENVRTFSPLVEVSEEDKVMLEEIATLLLEYPLVPCTACEYCMPCPYGINIPGIFQHYTNASRKGRWPQTGRIPVTGRPAGPIW